MTSSTLAVLLVLFVLMGFALGWAGAFLRLTYLSKCKHCKGQGCFFCDDDLKRAVLNSSPDPNLKFRIGTLEMKDED